MRNTKLNAFHPCFCDYKEEPGECNAADDGLANLGRSEVTSFDLLCDELFSAFSRAVDKNNELHQMDVKHQMFEGRENKCNDFVKALHSEMDDNDKLHHQMGVKNQLLAEAENKCSELTTALKKAMDENDKLHRQADVKNQMLGEKETKCK
ncbi:hypothetical protein IFM89_010960 [Coptis chinensis]|uniref:Uncharacterized protein n=1 Tax=Coptis chinensis TaxID=261450 RepID=A0A835IJQ5_9MAGN|nr:hypothetical protein IFM89_010960 [Coptis chinensis]